MHHFFRLINYIYNKKNEDNIDIYTYKNLNDIRWLTEGFEEGRSEKNEEGSQGELRE